MNPAYPGLAAATLYLVGAWLQIGTLSGSAKPSKSRTFAIGAAAVVLHGLTVALVLVVPGGVDLSLFSIASLTLFVLALGVLVASIRQPIENLFALVFPLAAICVGLSLIPLSAPTPRSAFGPGMLTHALASILAYFVLMVAACQSLALFVQESALRGNAPMRFIRVLPPLQTMETLLFQILWIGLVLLTFSIGSGFAFVEDMFAPHIASHTILAIASWVTFAILLLGRHAFGWRGKTAIRWTLAGFAFLALAYFVLEVVLGARGAGNT